MRRIALVTVAAIGVGAAVWLGAHRSARHSAAGTVAPGALRRATSTTSESATTSQNSSPSTIKAAGCADRGADPDPACTPGSLNPAVTQATIQFTICVSGYSSSVRPSAGVSGHLKTVAAKAYRIPNYNPSDFEGDHLIAIELGGNPENGRPANDPETANPDDVSNFFDEPHSVANPADGGSANKDRFENYLHRLVCSGAVPLAEAQDEIATDWYGNWVAAGRPRG